MRGVRKTALNVVLVLTPLIPTGCASWSNRVAVWRSPNQRQFNTSTAELSNVNPALQTSMSTAKLEETRGHLDVAKRLYEEIRQQDPQNAECLHRLAVVYTRLDQHSVAEMYFKQASALKPNDPEILADMGYAAFVCKKYAESEALLEQSLRLRDGDRRTITNLAIARAWVGKDDASLAEFRRVTSESEALRNLGAIQVARGDKLGARKSYDLAQGIDTRRSGAPNVIAQTAATDAPRQQVVDLPPPPPAPFTQPVISSTETIADSIAPLPPLPVISPYQHSTSAMTNLGAPAALAMSEVTHCTSVAIPPAPSAPNNPPAWIPTTPVETAPAPPIPPDAPDPAKDDYSTGQLPSPSTNESPSTPLGEILTTSVTPQASETATRIPSDSAVVLEPVAATERIPEPLPVAPALKFQARHPIVWRKTESSRTQIADDAPLSLNIPTNQKAASSLQADEEYSNVWNICLVTLAEEKRLVSAGNQFSMEYQAQQYHFSSAEALEKFKAAPQQYAPVAGGLDVVAVKNGRGTMKGSLNFGLWYHRQLYLFSNALHAEEFRRHPEKYIAAN